LQAAFIDFANRGAGTRNGCARAWGAGLWLTPGFGGFVFFGRGAAGVGVVGVGDPGVVVVSTDAVPVLVVEAADACCCESEEPQAASVTVTATRVGAARGRSTLTG
jgi:hypothetical protein